MFSGCMDCQTSADVPEVSKLGSGGACVNAMVQTLVSRFSGGVLGDGILYANDAGTYCHIL